MLCTHVSLHIVPPPILSRQFYSVIADLLGHRIMSAFAVGCPSQEGHRVVYVRVVMSNGLEVNVSIRKYKKGMKWPTI